MITSAQNPKIQQVRALLSHPRQRRESETFVVEGVRMVEEALASGSTPLRAFYSTNLSTRGLQALEGFYQQGAEVEEISEHLMQSLSDTETPQGILAVFVARHLPIPKYLDFVLILDELRDPGNLGTILRTAAAAGTQLVILTPKTCDPFAPKVLRAGMGAHFHLPILTMTWDEIVALCRQNTQPPLNIFLAEAKDGTPCWSSDLKKPLALIIGSEAEGVSAQARQLAQHKIHVPMPGKSESLNAAIAAAILIFEVVRQRASGH